jgi:ATP-dependent exoDNAse (exonuclease V) beta subunit
VEGQLVAETLMEYGSAHPDDGYCYDVLSDEAMFLNKASSVKSLLATLRYLAHPDDDVAARTMWYHRERLKGTHAYHELFDKKDISDHIIEEVKKFEEKKAWLVQLPLFELAEELVELLGFNALGMERAYLSGFKEAVFDYVSKNKSDIGGFLEWWDLNQGKRTIKIPDGHDAIRVLTIHKSKGLQFKVVLMPFMDWDIVDSKGVIWSEYEENEFSKLIVPLSLTAALAETSFADRYRKEVMMAYLDSLNMIYVALTRSEEVFWALAEAHQSKGSGVLNKLSFNIQMAVRSAKGENSLMDLSTFYKEEKSLIEIGNWPEKKKSRESLPPIPALSWTYRNWTDMLQVKKYQRGLSEERAALQSKRNFGLFVHRILEKLTYIDELDGMLQDAYFKGLLSLEEKGEVTEMLEQLFDQPQMKEWFSKDVQVLTEQGILMPGGMSSRPDRIILAEDKTLVIDFKTGEEKEAHHNQVREYMNLVKDLRQKPAVGYLIYIESGEIKKVPGNN